MRGQWEALRHHSSGVAKAMPGQVWLLMGIGGRIPPLLGAFALPQNLPTVYTHRPRSGVLTAMPTSNRPRHPNHCHEKHPYCHSRHRPCPPRGASGDSRNAGITGHPDSAANHQARGGCCFCSRLHRLHERAHRGSQGKDLVHRQQHRRPETQPGGPPRLALLPRPRRRLHHPQVRSNRRHRHGVQEPANLQGRRRRRYPGKREPSAP